MTDISGFSVARRAPGDLALHHEPYQPNSLEYKCITSALDIGLSILEQDRSKEVLTEFVLMFDDVTSNSACFKKDEAVARRCTDWFVDQLRANAPIMILDETLGRLEVMAYHPRSLWNGSLVEFPFRQQSVHLNAQRAKLMLAAKMSRSSQAKQRFQGFQFAFATTIVHELGNIFVTWLGRGRANILGGRWLEIHLFGGRTEFWRDHNKNNEQVGEPYQIDENGWAWRISPDVINEVCGQNFKFPFARTNEGGVNPHGRQRMNSSSDDSSL